MYYFIMLAVIAFFAVGKGNRVITVIAGGYVAGSVMLALMPFIMFAAAVKFLFF